MLHSGKFQLAPSVLQIPLTDSALLAETPTLSPSLQFVALYDYDPQKSSPSANPEFELCVKEGNLVKVFGMEMSDGFLMGEVKFSCEGMDVKFSCEGMDVRGYTVTFSSDWT